MESWLLLDGLKLYDMIYDGSEHKFAWDCQWHCPFPPEWVEKMAQIAKDLGPLTEEMMVILHGPKNYVRPRLEWLNEPQDARGLPLSYCDNDETNHGCRATYDYDSIPDVVVTNGYDDWPYMIWEPTIHI